MKKAFLILCALLSLSMRTADEGDNEDTQAMFKAAYLYSFTKLVDWPEPYKEGDFVIGVLDGGSSLMEHLNQKYGAKTVGSQEIHIKNFQRTKGIDKCHILFIPEDKNAQAETILNSKRSTLIVTEKEGALDKGAVINFVVKDQKLEYELSTSNAERKDLIIGSQLKDLALKVVE